MSPNRVARALACLVLLAHAPLGAMPAAAGGIAPACAPDRAILLTDAGTVAFRVEIADDTAERAQGLMNRPALDRRAGMLFIYQTPREVAFWMRNTLIPLDMVFFDAAGVIRHIHHDARPLDDTPIPGAAPGDPVPQRLMILEIPGGEAARSGLAVGQAMAHPALDQRRAALPCAALAAGDRAPAQ